MNKREQRKLERSRQEKPVYAESVVTIAQYGPDDKTVTKVVASYVNRPGGKLKKMKKWVGTNITETENFRRELLAFVESHSPKNVVLTEGVMGCPHEEIEDYPKGEACPICPFWAGRNRFATARPLILRSSAFGVGKKWPGTIE